MVGRRRRGGNARRVDGRGEKMPSPVTADMTRWLRYDVTPVCRIDLRQQTKHTTVVRHTHTKHPRLARATTGKYYKN